MMKPDPVLAIDIDAGIVAVQHPLDFALHAGEQKPTEGQAAVAAVPETRCEVSVQACLPPASGVWPQFCLSRPASPDLIPSPHVPQAIESVGLRTHPCAPVQAACGSMPVQHRARPGCGTVA